MTKDEGRIEKNNQRSPIPIRHLSFVFRPIFVSMSFPTPIGNPEALWGTLDPGSSPG